MGYALSINPELLPDTKEEVLDLLTFSKKWELSNKHLESSDKDLRLALINDLMNVYSIEEIVDMIPSHKAKSIEKYLDEVLTDNKLI